MDAVDSLIIKVVVDNAQLQSSLNKSQQALGDFSNNVKTKLSSVFDVLLTGAALDVTKNMVTGFANAGSKLQFLSQTLHTSVSQLSLWSEAAKRSGGTAESFNANVEGMYKRINMMRLNADPEMSQIFGQLGVNFKDANGNIKDTIPLMEEVGQALYKINDPRYTQAIGAKLGWDDATYRMFVQNKSGLDGLLDSVRKSGTMTDEQAQHAVQLRNEWLAVGQTWDQIQYKLTDTFLPALQGLSDWASGALDVIGKLGEAWSGIEKNGGLFNIDPVNSKISLTAEGKKDMAKAKDQIKAGWDYSGNKEQLSPNASAEVRALMKQMTPMEISQMIHESHGLNAPGDNGKSRGIFQIQAPTASEHMGYSITNDMLDNPAFNLKVNRKIMADYMKQTGNNQAKALAMYNQGESGGARQWDRHGHSIGNYSETIIGNAKNPNHNPIPQSASLQPGSAQSGIKPGNMSNASINVHNLNLPSVTDPRSFAQAMTQATQPGYAFSSSQLA